MRGSSAGSLEYLVVALKSLVDGGADAAALGNDLLGAAAVLRDQVSLRRAATDPSKPSSAKSKLLAGVFGAHLGEAATGLIAQAGGLRWGASSDLGAALEELGVDAVVTGADQAGDGDRVETELYAFARTVTENHGLRDALSDPARSVADKRALVGSLLEAKASSATIRLVEEAVGGGHLTVSSALADFSRAAAAARNRTVATVRAAQPLTGDQQQRLSAALGRDSDKPVHLNVVIDPAVIGGLRVEIGDHVIDGTVASRVDDARRRVAG
jgi:F-type H+-transporting ATPase subunit delta